MTQAASARSDESVSQESIVVRDRRTNLTGADFSGALLPFADLSGATLSGAHLTEKLLSDEQLNSAQGRGQI